MTCPPVITYIPIDPCQLATHNQLWYPAPYYSMFAQPLLVYLPAAHYFYLFTTLVLTYTASSDYYRIGNRLRTGTGN